MTNVIAPFVNFFLAFFNAMPSSLYLYIEYLIGLFAALFLAKTIQGWLA